MPSFAFPSPGGAWEKIPNNCLTYESIALLLHGSSFSCELAFLVMFFSPLNVAPKTHGFWVCKMFRNFLYAQVLNAASKKPCPHWSWKMVLRWAFELDKND
jgi:hypothetical protein